MKCFIDKHDVVRVESFEYIYMIEILGKKLSYQKTVGGNQYFQYPQDIPLHQADKIVVNDVTYALKIGMVTLEPTFEKRYRYDGFLGSKYTEDKTEFRVFSPVAKEMYVVIDDVQYPMIYEEPIWKTIVEGNLEYKKYHYDVRLVDTFDRVIDPYAIAGDWNESVIIDIDKATENQSKFIKFSKPEKAVIYEGHVRDLTVNLNVPNSKKYLGLIDYSEELKMSVLTYVKKLGVTHLQLLPLQDFVEVDQENIDRLYNWGYNPQQYFVLSGWYSSDHSNPYMRINEFKKVVESAHELNLGVTVDVVYNHVYQRGMFPYDRLVPGYFFRHTNGVATNSSYVGNDIETRNYMVRKLIVDSLVYLTKTFKIDGFRFDLMGLMDIETMLLIEKTLKKINPNVLLYGEGWKMDNAVSVNEKSHMYNNDKFPSYGHFNDYFRNVIKGDINEGKLGYGCGSKERLSDVKAVLKGSNRIFLNPSQSLNYIECHDNLTFNDQMTLLNVPNKDRHYYQDFANHLIAISKGIIFYHAGQEMYRTKQLVENSYNSPDEINGINWLIGKHTKKLQEILKIRKKYWNQPNEEIAIKIDHELLILELSSVKGNIKCYIKNDFTPITINEKSKLLFTSQDIINEKHEYKIDKPGIYLFLK